MSKKIIRTIMVIATTFLLLQTTVYATETKSGALDWFETVQYIFPRDSDALVTDVLTGKSFHVKRTYGTNHADVEPLSKDDTEIIKEIWGGFSWDRRAVIVEIDGYVIAGSMTAFPHAGLDDKPANIIVSNRSGGFGRGINYDVVKDNGIDGHMDIHFLNSKTHGTKVKQSSHQNKVKEAAEYISVTLENLGSHPNSQTFDRNLTEI